MLETLAASVERAVSFSARIERVKCKQVFGLLSFVVVEMLYTPIDLDEDWS